MENLTQRITIRISDAQSKMIDVLQKEVLQDHNRSEILRIILEAIYTKSKNAGY